MLWKHATLTVHQKIEIIRKLESNRSQREVVASYNIALSTIHDIKKWKDNLQLVMVSHESVKDIFKGEWFTAMHSEGKAVTGHIII